MAPPTIAEVREALPCEWFIATPEECAAIGEACAPCAMRRRLDDSVVIVDKAEWGKLQPTRDDAALLAESALHLLDHLALDAPAFRCGDIGTVRRFAEKILDRPLVIGLVAGWPLGKYIQLDADSADVAVIDLLTPKQLHRLPAGTVVTSIFGEKKTVGLDKIDEDTRGNYVAWGLRCPTNDRTVHSHD